MYLSAQVLAEAMPELRQKPFMISNVLKEKERYQSLDQFLKENDKLFKDFAMAGPGGIALKSQDLNIQETGPYKDEAMLIDPATWQQITSPNFQGFIPEVINISPYHPVVN